MKKCLPLFLVLSAFIGCTHLPIKNLRENESKLGYEFNTFTDTSKALARANWRVLRDPVSKKKYTDSSEAYQLIEKYNIKQNDIKFTDLFVVPKAFNYGQYKSGQEYFKGVTYLRNKKYKDAFDCFKTAVKKDADLLCYSDVYYLMAVCAYNMGDTARAEMYFDNFANYSESIIPSSFCYKNNKSVNDIKDLLDKGYAIDSLYSGHFADSCKGPVLKHFPYYGFLSDTPLFNTGLSLNFYQDGDNLRAFTEITFKRFSPYVEYSQDYLGLGLKYQAYRSWDNRIGVLSSIQYQSQDLTANDINVKFCNYSLELQAGYYLFPRLCLFLGGNYYYWNENNKYYSTMSGQNIWHNNDAFAGAGFFIWEHLALVGKYSRNRKMQAGITLFGMDVFYNLSDQKGFYFGN